MRWRLVAISVLAAASACGRYWFAPLGDDAGARDASVAAIDGGDDDASVGGPPDAGLPVGCMVVTIGGDEDDPGESATPPHLGAGLSLREAIGLANSTAGHDCIGFAAGLIVRPTANLPALTDASGAIIDGVGSGVIIDGSLVTAGAIGLNLAASDTTVARLELRAWLGTGDGTAVRALANTTVGPDVSIDVANVGVLVVGSTVTVHDNRISGCVGTAVVAAAGVANVLIAGNVIFSNAGDGVQADGGTLVSVQHNTFHQNNGAGLVTSTGSSVTPVDNNVFSQNDGFAIDAPGVSIGSLDHNAYFSNGGDCRGCVTGPNAVFADPMFAGPPADLSLLSGSPLIDAGRETGIDVNGDAPGLFNGAGPDIGAIESP